MPTVRTNQEMFDHVLHSIRKQGRPSISSSGLCLYITDDGCRCSAGHLMDNPRADLRGSVYAPNVRAELELSGVRCAQIDLAKKLQEAHDNAVPYDADTSVFLDNFEGNMYSIAKKYGFNYLAPEEEKVG